MLACDLFLDADTRECADDCERAPGNLASGLDRHKLSDTLNRLASRNNAAGCAIVYGSGFEDRPELLEVIGHRFRLLGNSAETVRKTKDSDRLAFAARALGIRHPQTAMRAKGDAEGWLVKRRGGSGGTHVRHFSPSQDAPSPHDYFQRFVPGRAVSLLFASAPGRFVALGVSEQWTDPTANAPFRFGGAAQPAGTRVQTVSAMIESSKALAGEFGLRGLCSADFIVDGKAPVLIEINPRPGATLDIFRTAAANPIDLHLACFDPDGVDINWPGTGDAGASAVVYAESSLVISGSEPWPEWTADRPPGGTRISPGDPVCTVMARGPGTGAAKALVKQRMVKIREFIYSGSKGPHDQPDGNGSRHG